MLPDPNRLQTTSQFSYVFRHSKLCIAPYFKLYINYDLKRTDPQVGIVVSKKVGNAVVRNTVKRRMREILRAQLPNIKKNAALVFVMNVSAASASFSELKDATEKLLPR